MTSPQRIVLRDALIDFGVGTVFGLVTSYWFALGHDASFVSGILLFIALQLFRNNLQGAEIRRQSEHLLGFLSAAKTGDAFGELRLLYHHRGTATLSEHSIDVGPDKMLELWKDAFSRTKSSWRALQHAPAGETWDLGWGKSSAAFVQEERIKAGCTVERIFIYENAAEQKQWEQIRTDQAKIGVKVSQVNHQLLAANPNVQQRAKFIGSLDVAMADSKLVFLILLDAQRRPMGARLTDESKVVEAADFILTEAKSLAG